MTAVPPVVDRAAARRSLAVEWSVGLLVAAAIGLVAALLRPEDFWLVFGVFTACSLGPAIGLAWLVVGRGRSVPEDPHAEENVESRWFHKAATATLLDLLMVIGLLAGALSVTRLDLPADLVLLGVWGFAVADGGLRFAVLRRREA
jgi:hypothetical protein